MANPLLPRVGQPATDAAGHLTQPWAAWAQGVTDAVVAEAAVAPVETAPVTASTISANHPLAVFGSLADGEVHIGLSGAATTDDLNEGLANLYYTDDRADARAAAAVATHEAAADPHPQYLLTASLAALVNAVDDAAAATAGVPIGSLYRNGSALMIRVA